MSDKVDQQPQTKTPEIQEPEISPDIKKAADELLVKIETDQKLDVLADDVLDPELKKVFDKIDGEQEEEDRQDQTFTEIQQLVQGKKYIDAASKILRWLSGIFFKDAEKPWLDAYKNLDDDIDFASLDDTQLQDYIHDMDAKINATSNYNKKLKYTYLLSLSKDYIYKKEHSIELDPKAPRQCLQHELQAGNILLLNKWDKVSGAISGIEQKIATTGIQDATDSIWMHSAIISKIENRMPYIIHSTGTIGADGKSGVDEVRLDTYLQWYTATDILVLSWVSADVQTWLTKTVDDITTKQMGKEYDDGAAIAWLIGGLNNKIGIKKEDSAKVNCVEILAETMAKVYTWFESTASIKTPKDFLLQKNLKPAYLATLEAKSIA